MFNSILQSPYPLTTVHARQYYGYQKGWGLWNEYALTDIYVHGRKLPLRSWFGRWTTIQMTTAAIREVTCGYLENRSVSNVRESTQFLRSMLTIFAVKCAMMVKGGSTTLVVLSHSDLTYKYILWRSICWKIFSSRLPKVPRTVMVKTARVWVSTYGQQLMQSQRVPQSMRLNGKSTLIWSVFALWR